MICIQSGDYFPFLLQTWEFIYGKPDFWYDSRISNRRLDLMSDLNQTVEFIKEIEKLKSVNKFGTLDDGLKIVPSIPGRVR